MSINFTFTSSHLNWSEQIIESKLLSISKLSGKKQAWVTANLDVKQSNFVSRLIWTIFAKRFDLTRRLMYGVDLKQSQLLLRAISKQLPEDSKLLPLFKEAVLKFNQIAPHHCVELPVEESIVVEEEQMDPNLEETVVHLVGDSVFDNGYWFIKDGQTLEQARQSSELDVTGQLSKLFVNTKVTVLNHAYDGFRTTSLLNGDTVGAVLPAHGNTKENYLKIKGKKIVNHTSPLQELQTSIESRPKAKHIVVLSVGGNDFRVLLGQPKKFVSEIPRVQERYFNIVDQIQKIQGVSQLVLSTQYKTSVNDSHYGIYGVMAHIGEAMLKASGTDTSKLTQEKIAHLTYDRILQSLYGPIFERAKKSQLPILNLSKTFDPNDSDLYLCEIEPSEKGGKLIAEGIHHIITHKPNLSESVEYVKLPGTAAYRAYQTS